jgi:hypothetical protein
MATISKTDFPYTGPYSKDGNGKHKGNTALALKRAMSRLGHLPWEPEKWDNAFNQKLEDALDKWDPGKNGYAEGRYDKIRSAVVPKGAPHAGEQALDSVCINQVQTEYAADNGQGGKVPDWGPVEKGGVSLLDFALSHDTSGIKLFPATDTIWTKGTTIIAPEKMTVYKASSSSPGDACYLEGVSGVRFWFGHMTSAPPVGKVINKGASIGVVGAWSGYTPHCHIGVNVEKLWGAGKELKHGNNYSVSGIPTMRKQFTDH